MVPDTFFYPVALEQCGVSRYCPIVCVADGAPGGVALLGGRRRVERAVEGRAAQCDQGATVRKSAVGGADGNAVALGCDIARTRATDEGIGEQWFLTPFSVNYRIIP